MQKYFIILCVLTLTISCSKKNKNNKMQLVNIYQIKTNNTSGNNYEPSGLTLWDGEFYTVSDKHDAIFKLHFDHDKIILKPIITINNDLNLKLDFEGITHDDTHFYLASEGQINVLQVSRDGTQQSWLATDNSINTLGSNKGMFEVDNAYIEGICLLNPNDQKFLLAVERQPRGLIEFNAIQPDQSSGHLLDDSNLEFINQRSPDFSGLSCGDGIHILERNADTVSEWKIQNGQFKSIDNHSFQHVMLDKNHTYEDMQYGHAEGLVVNGNKFYVLIDNNQSYFTHDKSNNNALFLELRK